MSDSKPKPIGSIAFVIYENNTCLVEVSDSDLIVRNSQAFQRFKPCKDILHEKVEAIDAVKLPDTLAVNFREMAFQARLYITTKAMSEGEKVPFDCSGTNENE